jgi:hypothetical protein
VAAGTEPAEFAVKKFFTDFASPHELAEGLRYWLSAAVAEEFGKVGGVGGNWLFGLFGVFATFEALHLDFSWKFDL